MQRRSALIARAAATSDLLLHDKVHLMPEVFDDLAEVHRVAGVSDDAPAPDAQPIAPVNGAATP